MYRSILVPLDGSTFSEHALPIASTIAQYTGARLALAHVHAQYATTAMDGIPVLNAQLQSPGAEQEQSYLEYMRARLQGNTGLEVSLHQLDGPIVPTLVRQIAASDIDLVVMTSHGRGGLARFWLGSVADGLIRQSPAPVLVIRPEEDLPDPLFAPAFRRILIPLDGSAMSEAILEPALRLGREMASEYLLVRVVQTYPVSAHSSLFLASEFDRKAVANLEEQARSYLESLAAPLRAEGYRVHTLVLVSSQPALAIMKQAQDSNADLITMATHARSGLPRMLIGSVTDKVLRGTDIPLLVARPQPERRHQHDLLEAQHEQS